MNSDAYCLGGRDQARTQGGGGKFHSFFFERAPSICFRTIEANNSLLKQTLFYQGK